MWGFGFCHASWVLVCAMGFGVFKPHYQTKTNVFQNLKNHVPNLRAQQVIFLKKINQNFKTKKSNLKNLTLKSQFFCVTSFEIILL
jgi:hypothetical protein